MLCITEETVMRGKKLKKQEYRMDKCSVKSVEGLVLLLILIEFDY